MEQQQAQRDLNLIGDAGRRVRRHSPVSNGLPLLVVGLEVLLCLPLFDFIAPPVAAGILAVVTVLVAGWSAWYAHTRATVQPPRADARRFVFLMLGWGLYYVVLLIGGITLLQGRLLYVATLLAPFAAAPLLIGGWLLHRRSRA